MHETIVDRAEKQLPPLSLLAFFWKGKITVLFFFIAGLVVSVGIIFFLPKKFESTSLVKIGFIENGPIEYYQELFRIIKDPLGRSSLDKKNDFRSIKNISDQDFHLRAISDLLIEVKARGKTPMLATQRANELSGLIANHHDSIIADYLEKKMKQREAEAELHRTELTPINDSIKIIESKITRTKKKIRNNPESSLYFYLGSLEIRLDIYNLEKIKLLSLEKTENFYRQHVTPTKIELAPSTPTKPVSLNMGITVMLGGMFGLTIGLAVVLLKNKA